MASDWFNILSIIVTAAGTGFGSALGSYLANKTNYVTIFIHALFKKSLAAKLNIVNGFISAVIILFYGNSRNNDNEESRLNHWLVFSYNIKNE